MYRFATKPFFNQFRLELWALLKAVLVTAVLAFNCSHVFAQSADTSTPDGLIKFVVNDVMNAVRADADIQKGNIPKIITLVEQKILPYSDFHRTTQLAMGRNWSKATPEQQAAIVAEFKMLLIRTYSGAISRIRNQTVQFKPFRSAPDDKEVVVKTVVLDKGDVLQLDYRLMQTPNGWRVYDVNVLGAWLIEAYRNQFTDQISQNGIDGLIKFLKDRNAALAKPKA